MYRKIELLNLSYIDKNNVAASSHFWARETQ